jgi:hypothetical protein
MIDRQQSDLTSAMKDVYSSEELDPNKTNAIDSSLWEVEVKSLGLFYYLRLCIIFRASLIIIIQM